METSGAVELLGISVDIVELKILVSSALCQYSCWYLEVSLVLRVTVLRFTNMVRIMVRVLDL